MDGQFRRWWCSTVQQEGAFLKILSLVGCCVYECVRVCCFVVRTDMVTISSYCHWKHKPVYPQTSNLISQSIARYTAKYRAHVHLLANSSTRLTLVLHTLLLVVAILRRSTLSKLTPCNTTLLVHHASNQQ
jgi:hypothetical protein